MIRTRFLLPVVLALAAPAALLGTAPEAASAPCQGSTDEARRHMERGFALHEKRQFVEAAAEFDAAYRAQPFSAFLINAAMAYQEALDFPNAISRYRAFLDAEPNPPDLARIRQNLGWLVAQHAARLAARAAVEDAGADGAAAPIDPPDVDAGAPPPLDPGRIARSQIIVVSDPPEAPLSIFARRAGAPPFVPGAPNPGWDKVSQKARTPHDLSLGPGDYHVVIDAFKDYRRVETDISLLPGHLYELKAVLSQGEFMGFLRVLSAAPGTRIYVDDPPPHKKPAWGRAPHGGLIESGPHEVWFEAPGYEPSSQKVVIEHGKTAEITPALDRVRYGYLRIDGNAEEVVVRIDGARRGIYTPVGEPLRVRLSSGPHRLELEAPDRKTFAGDVEVPRGQEIAVHGRLSFKPSRGTAVVSGALAVGAVVGGVALFKQASVASEPGASAAPGNAPTGAPTWLRVGGVISFGVGALLGASTVYSIVSDPTPPSTLKLDKPKDLDESDVDANQGSAVPGPRGRIFGDARVNERRCGAM